MKAKKAVFLAAAVIVVLIAAYLIYLAIAGNSCLDGRGTNIYFPTSALQEYQTGGKVPNFVESSKIAESTQSCSLFTYKIKENNIWKNVGSQEFYNFLEPKKNELSVYLQGWPYWGLIHAMQDDISVCDKVKDSDINKMESLRTACIALTPKV